MTRLVSCLQHRLLPITSTGSNSIYLFLPYTYSLCLTEPALLLRTFPHSNSNTRTFVSTSAGAIRKRPTKKVSNLNIILPNNNNTNSLIKPNFRRKKKTNKWKDSKKNNLQAVKEKILKAEDDEEAEEEEEEERKEMEEKKKDENITEKNIRINSLISQRATPSLEVLQHAAESAALARYILKVRAFRELNRPLKPFLKTVHIDKHIPLSFANVVDNYLLENEYIKARHDHYREKVDQYHLWHMSERTCIEFSVVERVISEVIKRLPSLSVNNILDYGSSTGANAWVMHNQFNKSIQSYIAIEPNAKLQSVFKKVVSSLNIPLLILPAIYTPRLSEIVIAAYSLRQHGIDKRKEIVDILWSSVKEGGILIVIEDGSLDGFEVVRHIRQSILDRYRTQMKELDLTTINSINDSKNLVNHTSTNTSNQLSIPSTSLSTSTSQNLLQSVVLTPPSLPTPRTQPSLVLPGHATVIAPCGHDTVCPRTGGDRACNFGHRILWSSIPGRSRLRDYKSKDALGGIVIENFSYVVLHKGPIQTEHKRLTEGIQPLSLISNHQISSTRTDDLLKSNDNNFTTNQLTTRPPTDTDFIREVIFPDSGNTNFKSRKRAEVENQNEEVDIEEELELQNSSFEYDDTDTALVEVGETSSASNISSLSTSTVSLPSGFYSARYHRIIAPPLHRHQHVLLDLCTSDGQLERRVIGARQGLEGGYVQAKSSRWGDLWQFDRTISRTGLKKLKKLEEDKKNGLNKTKENKISSESLQEKEEESKFIKEKKETKGVQFDRIPTSEVVFKKYSPGSHVSLSMLREERDLVEKRKVKKKRVKSVQKESEQVDATTSETKNEEVISKKLPNQTDKVRKEQLIQELLAETEEKENEFELEELEELHKLHYTNQQR